MAILTKLICRSLVACAFGTAVIAIRRIWFHPLSQYPGPELWAATRLPYVFSLLRGTLIADMGRFHAKYGDVVRLAPNELSFATEEAWKDIYAHRPGHKETKKDPVWYIAPNDMPQNIVTTADVHVRARMRRLLAPSFNATSLREQAHVLDLYAGKFLNQIEAIFQKARASGEPAHINFLDWINFYTMDIIGDLAMGESFGNLDESTYHPWVTTLHFFFRGMIIAASARFFPISAFLLEYLVPKSIVEKQKRHTEFTNIKIVQRLECQRDRPDLLTPFLHSMATAPEKMSLPEIQSTFAMILVAGSETTATTLVGVFYQLARNLRSQEQLGFDLRSMFGSVDEIAVDKLNNIAYLDAVIHEALRLCYAIPGGLPRIAPIGGDIYAGHYVPAGTAISIRPEIILTSEKYFKNAKAFIPDRWLTGSDCPDAYKHDKLAASQPFNLGPTSCIGKPLAWAEMRILIAKVIWRYKVKLAEGSTFDWDRLPKLMVVEKVPLWLELDARGPVLVGQA